MRESANALLGCLLFMLTVNPAVAQNDDSIALENTSWQLLAIHSVANSVFTPDSPQNYLLRFRSGGRLQIEADCNQAGATWQLTDSGIELTELVSTRKLCTAPSLFNRYLMNLERATAIHLENDRLVLQTSAASDYMVFEPYVFVPGS